MPKASAGRRAASYWFVDGLEEILFGSALLVSGASALTWRIYAPAPWMKFSWVFLWVGILLYGSTKRRILDLVKSRLTYPRTGYAQPPEEIESLGGEPLTMLSLQPAPPPKENVTSFGWRTVGVFLFFLVFIVVPFLNNPSDELPRWFVPSLMAALAAALYALNRKSEHPYRWWSLSVLGFMGLVFLWVDVPSLLRPFLPVLLGGSWLVLLGGLTLIQYLRDNPYPQASEGART